MAQQPANAPAVNYKPFLDTLNKLNKASTLEFTTRQDKYSIPVSKYIPLTSWFIYDPTIDRCDIIERPDGTYLVSFFGKKKKPMYSKNAIYRNGEILVERVAEHKWSAFKCFVTFKLFG